MNRFFLPAIYAVAFCGIASADLRVPSTVFKMNELEKARAKAVESKEPLIFVYTDPGTS